jgi:hypothetical protein
MPRNIVVHRMMRMVAAASFFMILAAVYAGERNSFNPGRIMTGDQRLNDDAGNANQYAPALAVHKYGLSVAAWPDSRNGGADIYFQLYSRRGQPFGTLGNVKVNDAGHTGIYNACDVAMDGYGNFMVVWQGGPVGVSHVYGQWYHANGKPLGGNIQIDETEAALFNGAAAVAGLDPGGAVAVWTDFRTDAAGDVMLQRFSRVGARQGSNVPVDAESDQAQKFPAVGADSRGNFTVVWQEGATGSKIMARRFDSEGGGLGDTFQVAPQSDPAALSCYGPAVSVSSNGAFAVIWMADYGGGEVRRQACLYDPSGHPLTGVFRVDEPGKFSYEGEVCAAAIANSLYLFVWSGNEAGDWNIYYRICTASGTLGLESKPVNDLPARQMGPDVAIDGTSTILFAWYDNRNANFDVYGTQLGPGVPHSLTAGAGYDGLVPISWEPPFGTTERERYLIYRGENPSDEPVLLATVDAASRPLPDRMLDFIDTTAVNGRAYYYAIRVDKEDTQRNITGPVSPVSGGHSIASAWSVTDPVVDGSLSPGEWDEASVYDISGPDGLGNVHLRLKNTNRMLYLAVVDSNDVIVEPATVLSMLFDMDHNGHWPKAAGSNEGLVALGPAGAVFWGYWGTYPDHLGGDALKTLTNVDHAISGGSGCTVYEVAIDLSANPYPVSGGMTLGFSLWVTDPGNFYGYHYGNAGEWPAGSLWEAAETLGGLKLAEETGLSEPSAGGPESFSLGQNYPNPFNPTTTIQFRVKEPCRVTLKVYDALGKEVAVLADGMVAAGSHSVRFDASGLPAGIYVYKIQMGDFTAARKMAVVE